MIRLTLGTRERERERQTDRQTDRQSKREKLTNRHLALKDDETHFGPLADGVQVDSTTDQCLQQSASGLTVSTRHLHTYNQH